MRCFTYSICVALLRILLCILTRDAGSQFFTRHAAALNHNQSLDRRMCGGAVRAAVTSVFEDENISLGAPSMILAQESAKVILAQVAANENSREAFNSREASNGQDEFSCSGICECENFQFSERDDVVQVPPNLKFRAAKALE